jgi:hypothetical protein
MGLQQSKSGAEETADAGATTMRHIIREASGLRVLEHRSRLRKVTVM